MMKDSCAWRIALTTMATLSIAACAQILPNPPNTVLSATVSATPTSATSTPRADANNASRTPHLASAAVTPQSAARPPRPADFRGIWAGQIDCGGGLVPIMMQIYPVTPLGSVAVNGELPNAKGKNPNLAYFSLRGQVNAEQILLHWERWTYKAQRFPQLNLEGRWLDGPERINLSAADAACKPFELRRRNADVQAALPTTTAVAGTVSPTSSVTSPLSYADLLKQITATKGDPTLMRPRLVGKRLKLKLRATGALALMVSQKDGVFFTCNERTPGFKGGSVTAAVTAYELTPEGDVSVELDRCAP